MSSLSRSVPGTDAVLELDPGLGPNGLRRWDATPRRCRSSEKQRTRLETGAVTPDCLTSDLSPSRSRSYMGNGSDSVSDGVSMASRSKSSPVSSSSSGEGERKVGGKSSEIVDSLRPEVHQHEKLKHHHLNHTSVHFKPSWQQLPRPDGTITHQSETF